MINVTGTVRIAQRPPAIEMIMIIVGLQMPHLVTDKRYCCRVAHVGVPTLSSVRLAFSPWAICVLQQCAPHPRALLQLRSSRSNAAWVVQFQH